eukprot:COSAG02_NODE_50_length_44860_cov_203.992739_20_plen_97_part_00
MRLGILLYQGVPGYRVCEFPVILIYQSRIPNLGLCTYLPRYPSMKIRVLPNRSRGGRCTEILSPRALTHAYSCTVRVAPQVSVNARESPRGTVATT